MSSSGLGWMWILASSVCVSRFTERVVSDKAFSLAWKTDLCNVDAVPASASLHRRASQKRNPAIVRSAFIYLSVAGPLLSKHRPRCNLMRPSRSRIKRVISNSNPLPSACGVAPYCHEQPGHVRLFEIIVHFQQQTSNRHGSSIPPCVCLCEFTIFDLRQDGRLRVRTFRGPRGSTHRLARRVALSSGGSAYNGSRRTLGSLRMNAFSRWSKSLRISWKSTFAT